MTSITIKLPEELKAKLETQARVRGKSRSALVRDSIAKDLGVSKKARGKKRSLLDQLQDLAGKGDSGIADLATDREYLNRLARRRR